MNAGQINEDPKSEPPMNAKQKIKDELMALGLVMIYFGCWFAALLVIKSLVLAEYHIQFRHYSMALVGALILGKVVLILEHVPLGSWVRRQPAWVDVLLRTIVYAIGVVVVMVLEKGFEGRHEHAGFGNAVMAALQGVDSYHVWVNSICISGALLFYNILAVVRAHSGEGGLLKMFLSPMPMK